MTMRNFVLYYLARRLLGVLARVVAAYESREADRQAALRAHPEGTRADR